MRLNGALVTLMNGICSALGNESATHASNYSNRPQVFVVVAEREEAMKGKPWV
jgi:hypothetical protein